MTRTTEFSPTNSRISSKSIKRSFFYKKFIFSFIVGLKPKRRINVIDEDYYCPHTDFERGWVATLDHLELNKALEEGYKVTHLYSVYDWKHWTDTIFKDYVLEFLKIKEESDWDHTKVEYEEEYLYELRKMVDGNTFFVVSNPFF